VSNACPVRCLTQAPLHAPASLLLARQLKKRFGNGIRQCFAFSSQNEIAARFLKQPQRNKLACLLREAFQIRSASSVTRAQRQRDSLRAFHFVRQIFARFTR